MNHRIQFQPKPVTQAVGALIGMLAASSAFAGPGFGDAYSNDTQTPFVVQSYFVSSPAGQRLWTATDAYGNDTGVADPVTGAPAGYHPDNRLAYQARVQAFLAKYPNSKANVAGAYAGTGKALRKFVDPLPLLGKANAKTMNDGTTSKYIPVASATKWVKPDGTVSGDDYYEIAVVEYADKFHSDLRKATTLRGYVQIDPVASNSDGASAMAGSSNLKLYYPNSSGKVAFGALDVVPGDAQPIMIFKTDANGKRITDASGNYTGEKVQARVFDAPHYLGPAIVATKDTPTRVKFLNLLPVGRAEIGTQASYTYDDLGNLLSINQQAVITKRNGDLFLPLDPSVPGSGLGPDGSTYYTQNRANLHLHGGDNPWISDGTPHQWITPGGEGDAGIAGSVAADVSAGKIDPSLLDHFMRGPGALNVPDMNDPGPGGMTYYFPNGQSSRLEWYHDHTVGITRLNVYAGMAAPYVLTDSVEQDLIATGKLPAAADTIPMVLQDKMFVPDDIEFQDERWNTTAWGTPGDMWYPHVYETVQDPNQWTMFNSVGRWHWGPWFWPMFPSLYNLPSGAYGDVTLTPEAWMDTPLVNGVAYPTLTVDPKTYRLRILNASNDRTFTFNMFVADSTVTTDDGRTNTEVKMIPTASWTADPVANPPCTTTNPFTGLASRSDAGPGVTTPCVPETWSTDVYGHNGGVPDYKSQGPTLWQIGSEGGFLPGVAPKDPGPNNFLLDKGRAAVLNTDYGLTGLHIGNAERADVIVDFSAYAGKTLIVYNDAGAPIPAADPRNEYFTGYGDNSATGGAEDTVAGYGPNTRTLMQIVVNAAPAATSLDPNALNTTIQGAYMASQESPVVAQSAYNAAFTAANPAHTQWDDAKAFAHIYTGSLKEPSFQFVPGTTGAFFNSILMDTQGSGYTRVPNVALSAPNDPAVGAALEQATAKASLKIDKFYVINGGRGYRVAPVVNVVANGPGSGVSATATMNVSDVQITSGGVGNYTSRPTVTFAKPTTPGGVQAVGTAIMSNNAAGTGKVVGVSITTAGSGYGVMPTVSFAGGGLTPANQAKGVAFGSVNAVTVDIPDPLNPASAGGGGYVDLSTAASEPANAAPGLNITFTAPPAAPVGMPAAVTATAGASGRVFDVTLVNPGKGYVTTQPTVTFTSAANETARFGAVVQATARTDVAAGKSLGSILVKTKAIQELFDPTYGRLNATFGVEIPYTSALTQTTIPLGYVDAPTEEFANGETQIWKITHNGVDTHPIHFHLLNVQLINRVGWDNFINPPELNELGWKETIKMSPLEDVIVAVRAKKPKTAGWGVPNSVRLLDPSQPEGALTGFTQIDPNTGTPATMANVMYDFGWEYVWHCHILGHEENDFMRPWVFHANDPVPAVPTNVTASLVGNSVVLGWTDNSVSEFKYVVEKAASAAGPWTTLSDKELANTQTYTDSAFDANQKVYRVTAVGQAGSTSATGAVVVLPTAPGNFAVTAYTTNTVSLSWTDSANETAYTLTQNGVDIVPALAANTVTTSATGLASNTPYSFTLTATNGDGSASAGPVSATTLPAAATNVTGSSALDVNGTTSVTVNWADVQPNNTNLSATVTLTTGASTQIVNVVAGGAKTAAFTGLPASASYTVTVVLTGAGGDSAAASFSGTTASSVVVGTPLNAAATASFSYAGPNRVIVTWTDNSNNETSFRVQRSTDGVNFVEVGSVAAGSPTPTTFIDTSLTASGTYIYRVVAQNVSGPVVSNSAPSNTATAFFGMAAPTGLTATPNLNGTRVNLSWTDASVGEQQFRVYASVDGGAVASVATVARTAAQGNATGGTAVTYQHITTPGSTYVYYVVAENGTVVSANSATATAVLAAPATPANLAATAVNVIPFVSDRVTLNWSAVQGAVNYTLQRSNDGGLTWANATTTANLTFNQLVVKRAAPYLYRVRANNNFGNSAYSTPVSIVANF